MIIRSQDKKGFVNLENIDTVCMNDEGGIYAFNGKSKAFIGTYSTEEKAIKVLDMICNKYFEHMAVENNGATFRILERPKVFQMPQDSEV